jgi:hypothetical protein
MTRWNTTSPIVQPIHVRPQITLMAAYPVGPRLRPPWRGVVQVFFEVEMFSGGEWRKVHWCREQLIGDHERAELLTDGGGR